MVIQGVLQGNVQAVCVDIERGAQVKGTVECEAARVNGAFHGELVSSQSLHVRMYVRIIASLV